MAAAQRSGDAERWVQNSSGFVKLFGFGADRVICAGRCVARGFSSVPRLRDPLVPDSRPLSAPSGRPAPRWAPGADHCPGAPTPVRQPPLSAGHLLPADSGTDHAVRPPYPAVDRGAGPDRARTGRPARIPRGGHAGDTLPPRRADPETQPRSRRTQRHTHQETQPQRIPANQLRPTENPDTPHHPSPVT